MSFEYCITDTWKAKKKFESLSKYPAILKVEN
jgi:hypothetical protein